MEISEISRVEAHLEWHETFWCPNQLLCTTPGVIVDSRGKKPGCRAQKQHGCSVHIACGTTHVSCILLSLLRYIHEYGEKPTQQWVSLLSTVHTTSIFISTGNATFGVLLHETNMFLHIHWETTTNVQLMHLPPPLMEFMWTTFGLQVGFCTEYVRDQFSLPASCLSIRLINPTIRFMIGFAIMVDLRKDQVLEQWHPVRNCWTKIQTMGCLCNQYSWYCCTSTHMVPNSYLVFGWYSTSLISAYHGCHWTCFYHTTQSWKEILDLTSSEESSRGALDYSRASS